MVADRILARPWLSSRLRDPEHDGHDEHDQVHPWSPLKRPEQRIRLKS
jgi:hypothetical protein